MTTFPLRNRWSVWALVAPLALAAAFTTRPAAGQGTSDKALAEALFQQGRDLLEAGKTAEACSRFEQSQKLEAKLGTLMNLADCHERLGRSASAWAEFTEAASLAERKGEEKRVQYARQHADALKAKLSHVVLRASETPDGMAITMDGRNINIAVLGAPMPLDPGSHTIHVSATGRQPWSRQLLVSEGPATVDVSIPLLANEAATAAPPLAPAPVPGPAQPPVTTQPEPSSPAPKDGGVPTLAWIGFGIAGVGTVVGTITGIVSISKTSDLKDACPDNECPESEESARSSANTMANLSNVSFAFAGAGAIMGIIVLATAGSDDGDEQSAVTVTPVLGTDAGPLGAGVNLRF